MYKFKRPTNLNNVKGFDGDNDILDLVEQCYEHGVPIIKKNGQTYSRNTLLKKIKMMKGGAVVPSTLNSTKTNKTIKDNEDDYHIDYKQGKKGQAILEDPLIQAYFNRIGVSNIEENSEIPVGLAMAIYGNHAQLGASGLSDRLPNVLENPELEDYWEEKGVMNVTPQTMIPVKFIFIKKD